MRRLIAVMPLLLALHVVGGCSTSGMTDEITVRGAFGQQPDVRIPKIKPDGRLDSAVLRKGTGRTIAKGDLVVAHYIGYAWQGTEVRRVDNSYTRGRPAPFALGDRGVIPALAKTLPGQTAGSRVLLVVPPDEGYGSEGFARLNITGADTLVFVMDLLAAYPKTAAAAGRPRTPAGGRLPTVTQAPAGSAPKVTIPRTKPPRGPVAETLIEGTGPPVRPGQLVVFHSEGRIWRNGEVFESSWARRGRPDSVVVGARQMIPGWDNAVVGRRVGSRVLAVVPPGHGYGSRGLPQAKIKGTDTLVFVIDILAAH